MSTVDTVRGSVAVADLGRTLMHEHVFVTQPEALQNFGHLGHVLGRGRTRRRRRREAASSARRRHRDDRRRDGVRARPLHPGHPADQCRGRPEHHRRHRRLRVPRAADAIASTSSTSTPNQRRIETLLRLLEEGCGDRVHLSHDAASFIDFMVGDPGFANEQPDYLHISTRVLPALREAGVTDDIDWMMIDNPRRFFTTSSQFG